MWTITWILLFVLVFQNPTSGHVPGQGPKDLTGYDAFGTVEAETLNFAQGSVIIEAGLGDGVGFEVAHIGQGDILGYTGIDFQEGANRVEFRLGQLLSDVVRGRAGTMYLRLGSPDSQPIADIGVNYRSGMEYSHANIVQYLDVVLEGVQDLYLTFELVTSGMEIATIDWFKFYRVDE